MPSIDANKTVFVIHIITHRQSFYQSEIMLVAGTAYGNSAAIPQSRILASCSQACTCSVKGVPEITCASVDCVETFDSDIQEQCVSIFEPESCCSTDSVCGKDAIAGLKTCDVDGETYYEGQQFEPINSGKSCVCSADWVDNLENTTLCRDINCGLELHHQSDEASFDDKCMVCKCQIPPFLSCSRKNDCDEELKI
ncbi:Uncharacterized protein OBRU01_17997 [Operophtera brumata]|uniref:VWFC domain-containing protein n=1 Tax=Operophtera brumata TaxID=104452 RepID=A0A0L7KZN7_OPEBR|nr:Uncharacterized protein OBRU01_17997 [Operophtera brumata]